MSFRHCILSGLVLCLTLGGPAQAQSGISMLRIACDGDAVNAEVSINGRVRGDCPMDVQVPAGPVRIDVVKRVGEGTVRTFSQEFRMGEGTVRRIDVGLGAPQLDAEGRRRAAEQERQAQQALAEQTRRDEAEVATLRALAETGDTAAMVALGERFAEGKGVAKNFYTAADWYGRAKLAGSDVAAFRLDALKPMPKPLVDEAVRVLSLPVIQERKLAIHGDTAVRAFVEADPFFDLPEGRGVMRFGPRLPEGIVPEYSCQRSGRLFECEYAINGRPTKAVAALGGAVIGLDNITDNGGMFTRATRVRITDIDSVDGVPFPLTPGKRFGLRFTTVFSGALDYSFKQRLSCAAGVQEAGALPVACVSEQSGKYTLTRMTWNANAGGFAIVSVDSFF